MKLTIALTVLLAVSVPGRALAQKIDIEFDDSADFAKFKTFALQNGQLNARAPALNSELTKKKIENELRKRLVERGLTEKPGGADLNVFFNLGARPKTEVDNYPAGWRGLRTRRVVTQETQGTLTIDLRDTSRRELVWRAIAVEEKSDPAKVAERLDEMIKKSIERYPPKKK